MYGVNRKRLDQELWKITKFSVAFTVDVMKRNQLTNKYPRQENYSLTFCGIFIAPF